MTFSFCIFIMYGIINLGSEFMSKSEKYGLIGILTILLIAIIVSGVVKVNNKDDKLANDAETIINNAQRESTAVSDSEKGEFTQIDLNQYIDMYNGSEKKIVLIARPTCGYCQVAEPIIQNLIYKYQLDINYLNTDNFVEGDEQKLIESNNYFKDGIGTPTLIIVSEGKVHDGVDGLTDTAHYKEFFKVNGYIE